MFTNNYQCIQLIFVLVPVRSELDSGETSLLEQKVHQIHLEIIESFRMDAVFHFVSLCFTVFSCVSLCLSNTVLCFLLSFHRISAVSLCFWQCFYCDFPCGNSLLRGQSQTVKSQTNLDKDISGFQWLSAQIARAKYLTTVHHIHSYLGDL